MDQEAHNIYSCRTFHVSNCSRSTFYAADNYEMANYFIIQICFSIPEVCACHDFRMYMLKLIHKMQVTGLEMQGGPLCLQTGLANLWKCKSINDLELTLKLCCI